MSNTNDLPSGIIPAQLGFLAIYNPSLGTTDDTLDDQIVYFTSRDSRKRHRSSSKGEDVSKEERNERLRKIGLAQGMVDFGRNFSDGISVDAIETEKSRIILHELEPGWWILASIDLTRLPSSAPHAPKGTPANTKIEYSSREVKPSALLLQDLVRAHRKFLLHHASSVSALFVRNQRQKFIGIFGRYWDYFTATWNVLLHGNPAVTIYGGIKLAASGELGVGVGEEERGSGERAVLEGLGSRVEGLVDIVVSKFGEAPQKPNKAASHIPPSRPWLGSGEEPAYEDGAIFLGLGALSRHSLRDITHWMEDLYTWGPGAYGVLDNPTSNRRTKARRRPSSAAPFKRENSRKGQPPSPLITQKPFHEEPKQKGTAPDSPGQAANSSRRSSNEDSGGQRSPATMRKRIKDRRPALRRAFSSNSTVGSVTQPSKFLSYFKLGYGTHWTLTAAGAASKPQDQQLIENVVSPGSGSTKVFSELGSPKQGDKSENCSPKELFFPSINSSGQYLIGLLGDIEEPLDQGDVTGSTDTFDVGDNNRRILLRTLTVELERAADLKSEEEISIDLGFSDGGSTKPGSQHTGVSAVNSFESQDRNKSKKLRVIVYINQPFIFTFLFEQRTDSLSWPTLYRSLHQDLGPLQKALLKSTSYRGPKPSITSTIPNTRKDDEGSPIYDVVWDPMALTISTSLPDIPSPLSYTSPTAKQTWSRLDALNTHSQILATYLLTRNPTAQYERTCKTSRGYWISWTRIPETSPSNLLTPEAPTPASQGTRRPSARGTSSPPFLQVIDRSHSQETSGGGSNPTRSELSGPAHPFLEFSGRDIGVVVRDKEIFLVRNASDYMGGSKGSSGSLVIGSPGGDVGWMAGVGGMGVDTKRYIEGLLNLR